MKAAESLNGRSQRDSARIQELDMKMRQMLEKKEEVIGAQMERIAMLEQQLASLQNDDKEALARMEASAQETATLREQLSKHDDERGQLLAQVGT